MSDRRVSLLSTIASILWGLGGTIVAVDLLVPGSDDLGHVGLMLGAAAATLHVRWFTNQMGREIHNAFELGRDTGRMESEFPVQRIR